MQDELDLLEVDAGVGVDLGQVGLSALELEVQAALHAVDLDVDVLGLEAQSVLGAADVDAAALDDQVHLALEPATLEADLGSARLETADESRGHQDAVVDLDVRQHARRYGDLEDQLLTGVAGSGLIDQRLAAGPQADRALGALVVEGPAHESHLALAAGSHVHGPLEAAELDRAVVVDVDHAARLLDDQLRLLCEQRGGEQQAWQQQNETSQEITHRSSRPLRGRAVRHPARRVCDWSRGQCRGRGHRSAPPP